MCRIYDLSVILERQNGTFAEEQKNMLVLTKIVPFITILELALTTIILKVCSALKTIHSMK